MTREEELRRKILMDAFAASVPVSEGQTSDPMSGNQLEGVYGSWLDENSPPPSDFSFIPTDVPMLEVNQEKEFDDIFGKKDSVLDPKIKKKKLNMKDMMLDPGYEG